MDKKPCVCVYLESIVCVYILKALCVCVCILKTSCVFMCTWILCYVCVCVPRKHCLYVCVCVDLEKIVCICVCLDLESIVCVCVCVYPESIQQMQMRRKDQIDTRRREGLRDFWGMNRWTAVTMVPLKSHTFALICSLFFYRSFRLELNTET